MKTCIKCKKEFPVTMEFFSVKKTRKDGFNPYCKACQKEYAKKYHENNKEKINNRNREYGKEYRINNKDKIKEGMKKYREKSKESIKVSSREYYEKNKEKIAKYRKNTKEHRIEYKGNNRERFCLYQQNRKTLKQNLPSTLTIEQWQSTKDYFNHKCAYCGKQLKNLSQDHVIPLSKGGGFTKGNIIPSCQPCNNSKRAGDMKSWYVVQTYFSIERYNKILAFTNRYKSKNDYTPIVESK